MDRNVGSVDQSTRVVAGAVSGSVSIAILLGAISLSGVVSLGLGVVALVLFTTALTGNCPAYSLLGINSCSRSSGTAK